MELVGLDAPGPEEVTNADGLPSAAMMADLAGERDRLRERVAALEAQGVAQVVPREIADGVAAAEDALADLRASLRAANDEVGVLGVEAAAIAGDSVAVLREALTAAGEQVEIARTHLKALRAHTGG